MICQRGKNKLIELTIYFSIILKRVCFIVDYPAVTKPISILVDFILKNIYLE